MNIGIGILGSNLLLTQERVFCYGSGMARPLRIEFPGAYYHVMNRGLARQKVFTARADYEGFLKLLSDCHEMWGVRVLAYSLLGNHYHLLIQTPQANLSRVMRHLDGLYTQRYNRRHNRDGPLFRGRYKAILVDQDTYLLAVARYIHRNPVAAGLVRFPETYAWSSCPVYLKEKGQPAWLDAEQILSLFPQRDRLKAFQTFMRSDIEEPVELFYNAKRGAPVLGAEGFVDGIRERIRQKPADVKEIPEAKRYLRIDPSSCLKAVAKVYGGQQEEILQGRRGRRHEARAMAMFVCRRLAGMKLSEIASLFGVGGYSAVSSAVGRMQRLIERRGQAFRRFKQIRSDLQI